MVLSLFLTWAQTSLGGASVVREGECDTESRVGSSDVRVGYGIFV